MIWKNLNANLKIKHLKKTFYNKKKNELLTIYSDGTFFICKLSVDVISIKKHFFFFNKKQRIFSVSKFGIGKVACLDLYGNITVINIFSMKKFLFIKTKKIIWMISYIPEYIIGLTLKGDFYIFSGKKFQIFTLFSIKKNQINYIYNKDRNTIICVHKNQILTEFNFLKSKFETKILLNKIFKSKISILKYYKGITVVVSTTEEIFFFNKFYVLVKKFKNNLLKFGKIIFVLNLYKKFFFYSTKNGFLCIFNLKKNAKNLFMSKKISNNIITTLHILKKKKFLELDTGNNYSFFLNKKIFSSIKIPITNIKWVNKENFSLNNKYLALFIGKFLLIWSNYYFLCKKYPSLVIKLTNTIGSNNFCCLAPKKDIIAMSLAPNKIVRFFKIIKFKNLYLCIELVINIQIKIKKSIFFNDITFSLDGKILCGIMENRKKFFILNFKKNDVFLFFVKISSKKSKFKNEDFLNLVLIGKQVALLTKSNSILIFNCKEGVLCFRKYFSHAAKIRSISTGYIKNRLLILLFKSGNVQIYKLLKKAIFKLKKQFFSNLKIKQINYFGYNNQNASLNLRNGILVIPFFFNINKKNFRVFQFYFLKTKINIFPITFRSKKLQNKLVFLKCY